MAIPVPAQMPTRPVQHPEFPTARAAADAAITNALERPAEAPAYFACVIVRQDGVITTRDTVEAAVRAAQQDRKSRVSLVGLDVGMIWSDQTGTTFLIEGLVRA